MATSDGVVADSNEVKVRRGELLQTIGDGAGECEAISECLAMRQLTTVDAAERSRSVARHCSGQGGGYASRAYENDLHKQ